MRNCCKPEHVGTKENGKILERIQVLEDGRVAAKEARNWKIEGQKEESRGQNIRGFQISLRWNVSWRKKDCGISLEKM